MELTISAILVNNPFFYFVQNFKIKDTIYIKMNVGKKTNQITKQVISVFKTRDEFTELLKVNPGLVIVKFGATWCGPCKRIAHIVEAFYASSPANVICADIDVDESFDLYSFMKHKRMVNGVPVMLCYKRGNLGFAPDDSVTGASPNDLDAFFKRCGIHLVNAMKNFPNPMPARIDSKIA